MLPVLSQLQQQPSSSNTLGDIGRALDDRSVQALLAGVDGAPRLGSQGFAGGNIHLQALQNLQQMISLGRLGGFQGEAGGFGASSGQANFGFDQQVQGQAHSVGQQQQLLDELWTEEEHNRFLLALKLQEQSGSINTKATAQHVGTKTEQQTERHCNLYMAALRRKRNLAQQMGQHGQILHLSLTELYSSLGLTVPNRAPAPAQTTLFSPLQINPAVVAPNENQSFNLSAMIFLLKQQQQQQQQYKMQAMHQTPRQQLLGQPLTRPDLNLDSLSKLPNNGIPSMLGLLGSHQEPVSTKTAATPVQAIASKIGGGGTNTFRQTLEQRDANEGPTARSKQLLQQTNPLNQAQMLLKQQLQQAPQRMKQDLDALSTVQLLRLAQQQKQQQQQFPQQSNSKIELHTAYQSFLQQLGHVGLFDSSEVVMLSGMQQVKEAPRDETNPSSVQAPDGEKRSQVSVDSLLGGGGDVQSQTQSEQKQQQNLPDAEMKQQKQKMEEHLRQLGGHLNLLQNDGKSPVSAKSSKSRSLSPLSTKSNAAGGKVGGEGNSNAARDRGRGEGSSPPASTASVTRGHASPVDDLSESERSERKRKTTDDTGSGRKVSQESGI